MIVLTTNSRPEEGKFKMSEMVVPNPPSDLVRQTSFEQKKTFFNAVTNPQKLSDMVNKPIKMVAHFSAPGMIEDDRNTGVFNEVIRTTIIDVDGVGYSAVSPTLTDSLNYIDQIFGDPANWPEPLTVQLIEVKSNKGRDFFRLIVL